MKGGLIDWDAARLQAMDLLARVGLEVDPDAPIKTLGVGQQQLVEIAKALSKNVKLLILDEPTAALNEDDSANLLQLMLGLKARGITCIMISHKLNEIAAVSDAVTVIRDGKTVDTYDVVAGQVDAEMRARVAARTLAFAFFRPDEPIRAMRRDADGRLEWVARHRVRVLSTARTETERTR